jgi:hypothetical protein
MSKTPPSGSPAEQPTTDSKGQIKDLESKSEIADGVKGGARRRESVPEEEEIPDPSFTKRP